MVVRNGIKVMGYILCHAFVAEDCKSAEEDRFSRANDRLSIGFSISAGIERSTENNSADLYVIVDPSVDRLPTLVI
jgi:hypothetical protein